MCESNAAQETSRPQFGNRLLVDEEDVYYQNAWDNVEWNEEQQRTALETVQKHTEAKMSSEQSAAFLSNAADYWNAFYDTHKHRFFKDRHWIFTEFPELQQSNGVQRSVFELGCGVGNTLLPILMFCKKQQLQLYGCDFSQRAIDIFRASKDFDAKRCQAFVMDITSEEWQVPFALNSLDIIVLVFVLSAIEPSKMQRIVEHCYRYLRPGGLVLFRDYGRYDMAQLRFKSGKCMQDNLYARGDGTMVYFFAQEELRELFTKAGFVEQQSIVDRRLQVNRGKMLKMYRVWLQCKYQKPLVSE